MYRGEHITLAYMFAPKHRANFEVVRRLTRQAGSMLRSRGFLFAVAAPTLYDSRSYFTRGTVIASVSPTGSVRAASAMLERQPLQASRRVGSPEFGTTAGNHQATAETWAYRP